MWNSLILGALLRGEKALSWQSPGGALPAFELGNAPLFGAFQGSRADAKQMRGKRSSAGSTAREAVERSETEGVNRAPAQMRSRCVGRRSLPSRKNRMETFSGR